MFRVWIAVIAEITKYTNYGTKSITLYTRDGVTRRRIYKNIVIIVRPPVDELHDSVFFDNITRYVSVYKTAYDVIVYSSWTVFRI